jgi:predicted nucleotidyltransferase
MMKNKEMKKIIALIIKELNPKKIILFGSRAKDNYAESADYDLAVDSKKISFRDKRKLLEKIEDVIGLHSVDLIYLKEVDSRFKKIILDTGKIIYER